MKTIVLLIPTKDNSIVERARRLVIEYLGTRTLDREQCYITGAIALNTILTPEEKEELANIVDNQKIDLVFLECKAEVIETVYKKEIPYIDVKLSLQSTHRKTSC